MNKKKVACVVGHKESDLGACGVDGIPCEWNYNSKVVDFLKDVVDIYYYDPNISGYKTGVKANAKELNKNDYELVLELHYNAVGRSDVSGCEVLYYFKNSIGEKLAAELSAYISETFGLRDRGAKPRSKSTERGYWALYYPRATTLIVEPFFGSNPKDVALFKDNEKEYADSIRDFLKVNKLI